MEKAMRRRAGRNDIAFLKQKLGVLTGRSFEESAESPKMLQRLAGERALLRDPRASQGLMSACLVGHGAEGVRECLLKAREVGGIDQFYAFQLLYNHLIQTAKLDHARGARSWTEQMTDEV
jgi:hypothetical protein